MTPAPVCPAYVLAHCAPDLPSELSEIEVYALASYWEVWRRPEQIFPLGKWRSLGFICGRGFGKTEGIAAYMNAEIEAGRIRAPGLMGPTADRVDEIQIEALIRTAPPWFKPERYSKTIRWPNGVIAEVHSAEAPDSSRSSNLDFTWMVEIVAWQHSTRVEAFNNITTATRVGRAQFVWDTTSKGKNELILALEALHAEAPRENQIVRGTTFDNPMLSRVYLRNECRKYRGRRRQEELEGKVFAESAGALWSQDTIDNTRRPLAPESPALVLVSVDPAQSAALTADEFGICIGARGRDGHAYTLEDRSGHYTPDEWGKIVVDRCALDAAGVLIERNRAGGDSAAHVVVSEARTRGMKVEILPRGARVPARRAGVIFIKEIVAASDKASRAAGPAAEYLAARAHLVGEHPELELEMTTYEPGTRKSPNRYDAHAYLVTELAGLEYEDKSGSAADDARGAAVASENLRKALLASARGRRIGL